jgi:hypothetical protein
MAKKLGLKLFSPKSSFSRHFDQKHIKHHRNRDKLIHGLKKQPPKSKSKNQLGLKSVF